MICCEFLCNIVSLSGSLNRLFVYLHYLQNHIEFKMRERGLAYMKLKRNETRGDLHIVEAK